MKRIVTEAEVAVIHARLSGVMLSYESGGHCWHFLNGDGKRWLCSGDEPWRRRFRPAQQTRPLEHESARPMLCPNCVKEAGIDHMVESSRRVW